MAYRTKERSELIKGLLLKHKDMPSRTLAKLMYQKHAHLFPTIQGAYGAVRYYRGEMKHCYENRKCGSDEFKGNKIRDNGSRVHQLPPSKASPWEPFVLDSTRVLVMSDIHIPFHDANAVSEFVKWGKKVNPNAIILNGDIVDFYTISRFEKNLSITSLKEEIDSTREFLGWLRQQFPKARIIYKEGNHDERLSKYIFRKAPELFGIPEIELPNLLTGRRENESEIRGIEWVGDQRRIDVGGLTILHGHELGKGSIAPPVNPARGSFVKALESTLVGHLHRTSQHSERSINGKIIECWSTGCFCNLWPEYARVNRWTQGGAFIDVGQTDYYVSLIDIRDGKCHHHK